MHPPARVRGPRTPTRRLIIIGALLALLLGGRSLAALIIEYEWWKEVGQLATWQSIILYSIAPQAAAALIAFAALWVAHARGLKYAGTRLREYPVYSKVVTALLLLMGIILAQASLDPWTIVSYFGSARAGAPAQAWRDPIFGHSLAFYFFELPLYSQLIGFVSATAFLAALVYWLGGRIIHLSRRLATVQSEGIVLNFDDLDLGASLRSPVLRGLVALFLFALAARASLQRFSFLGDDHGFLVGVDYVAHKVQLPLLWLLVAALCLAGVFVLVGRWKLILIPVVLMGIRVAIPPIISAAYVKPNEISLQKPYIEHHIKATRSAYDLDRRLQEVQFPAKLESTLDLVRNRALLENVRLWDWRAFHDTVTQIQALRQYYAFADTDVDRYMIDGNLRQVMLAPRELDIRQLPDARANWINGHFIYTHGYGLVMAEANKITATGQPVLFIHDAPPKVETKSLKLTRPELYYGEVMHEPVFVRTEQPEFNYPAGDQNVQTRYEGKGGIPISGFGMRLAAAVALADRNVLLTGYLNSESRMMINRNIRRRVEKIASFIDWDPDPYLIVTDEGRLVWMIDGYTSSWRHPYSRRITIGDMGSVNYVRNSVKATVDAYDGSVSFYLFDKTDPIVRAFAAMFPSLFKPDTEMPADLRTHARHPELFFRAQAEIYRTFHMQNPEAFYNREDLWDLGRNVHGQNNQPEAVQPTYVVATLPGESTPEYLLIQPFTPRSKDNLIGLMVARCDGERMGEIRVLQLSKQSLIYGPLQIEARIDSDQNISKDLSLWNQQGSQVLRGQMLVLPLQDTFLYVEPIYIQSAQARMPQLKKVVLAMGNTLIYRDTYEQALADLGAGVATAPPSSSPPPPTQPVSTTVAAAPPPSSAPDTRLETARNHLRKYRELSAQGKWAEAGRELEALEKLVAR